MRRIYFIIRWLLIFIAGALFTMFLVPLIYHRYDDHGVGEYYGIIRGRVFGYDPESYVEVSGQSHSSFRLAPPRTYMYDTLDLTIVTFDGTQLRGQLGVPEMTLATDGANEPITEQSFATLLLGPNARDDRVDVTNEIFAHLRSAGTGEFPPPRHHHYSFGNNDSRLSGNIAHWSMGSRVPHLLLYWMILWFGLLLLIAFRKRASEGGEQKNAPESRSRAF